jgi:prepilin-type N-terminal cleavage/methylation domain-containing protein
VIPSFFVRISRGFFPFPRFGAKDFRRQGRGICPRRLRLTAFTLTELLVSVGIIAILATLAIQGYSKIVASVAKGRCIGNLRNLHVCFATYVQDNGHWPQQPDFSSAYSQQYQDWWLKTMDPYTQSREVWKCPLLKKFGAYGSEGGKLEIHYTPTRFDARPTTPFRWEKQPWLIEVSNIHGKGPLLLMPDGSVRSLTDLVPNFYRTKG